MTNSDNLRAFLAAMATCGNLVFGNRRDHACALVKGHAGECK